MKLLLLFFVLPLASCGIIPIGGYSIRTPADLPTTYIPEPIAPTAYEAPAYCPPPPLVSGSTWTPNSPTPFTYYNIGPAGGSAYTPGVTNALHPFTYFNP